MRTRLARLLLAAARRLDRYGSVVPRGATRTVEIAPGSWQLREVAEQLDERGRAYYVDRPLGPIKLSEGGPAIDSGVGDRRVAELDAARPEPTSVADAVCMCCYGADGERDYRCRACTAGFGPDRQRRPTPWEQWSRRRID